MSQLNNWSMRILIRLIKCKFTSKTKMDVFIIITAFLQIVATHEVKLKCSNIDEFYYAKPGSHCTKYYKCNHHAHKDIKECGPGSMFDFYKQICTRSSGVCYEPVCTGRTNGIYQDTTHACRRSFTCYAGRVVSIDNCPPSHLHNGHQCVHQELVMCQLPQTTAIGYPFSGDTRCIGKLNMNYGINDCQQYVLCQNEEVIDIKTCPDGFRFKNDYQQCVIASDLPICPDDNKSNENLCKLKVNGPNFDPLSTDCKTYIICRNEKFQSREKCTNQAIFNGKNCVPDPLYTCPRLLESPENDICRQEENGFFMNPKNGCSSYVRCMSGGTVETYDCPTGQYFDPEEKNCIFEKFYEKRRCLNRIKSSDCSNSAQGFYQDISKESQCTKYYYCLNDYKTEYKCSTDRIFDGENCVDKATYTCPTHLQNSCRNQPDNYYIDPDNGCRSYYYCSNGHKITYLCEEGHIFDGTLARCTRENGQNQCSSIQTCIGKSDGYHPDLKSNCRDYMYCLNHEKITQFTCRGSKIFDGEKCVSPNIHTCPSNIAAKQLNCIPKQCPVDCLIDGFFQDINSKCEKYYFCIEGKRSTLQCTAGQVFNGEICVPQDQYICPIFCDDNLSSLNCSLNR